jgi:D-alanyl-D-alanine carboxypeptidase (penicillin-binding protein 5/6)
VGSHHSLPHKTACCWAVFPTELEQEFFPVGQIIIVKKEKQWRQSMHYHQHWTKMCVFTILVSVLFILGPVFNNIILAAPSVPELVAEAAVIVDADTGYLMGAKNADVRLPMASTTKIITALLTLEQGDLMGQVEMAEEAVLQEGSSMYTSIGEVYTVEELLYGLMLNSGNDAAWALAEHIGGDVDSFVRGMNKRVRELGAANTNFANPSGLPDPDHYTTAYDMALIAKAAMERADFCRIVGTKAHNVPWPVKETEKQLVNHNKLLWRYEGADGIKTGYTNEARQCLVASASRGGRRLIAVVLKSENEAVWNDAQLLLDWGFENFDNYTLASTGEKLASVPVKRGQTDEVLAVAQQDMVATLKRGEEEKVRVSLGELPTEILAPVEQGQHLGKAAFTLDGKNIGQVTLVADSAVPRKPKPWWFWVGLLFLLWLLYEIIVWDLQRRRRRMRLKWAGFRYRGP